jgi:hypothetical protein
MPQRRKIRSTGNNRSQPHSTAPHLNDQNRVHQVAGHRFISGEKTVGCFIVLILWALYDGFLAFSSTMLYEQKTSPAMWPNGREQEASVPSKPGENINTLSIIQLNDFLDENDASKVSSAPSIVTNPNYLIFHHYVHTTQSSAIEDMLMCHAYAFHMNATYGGACSGADTPEMAANEALLDAIGLREALPFKCSVDYPKTRVSMIPRSFGIQRRREMCTQLRSTFVVETLLLVKNFTTDTTNICQIHIICRSLTNTTNQVLVS